MQVVMANHSYASYGRIKDAPLTRRHRDIIILHKKEIRPAPICRRSPDSITLRVTTVIEVERLAARGNNNKVVVGHSVHSICYLHDSKKVNLGSHGEITVIDSD